MKTKEEILKDFKDEIRNVVANAILKKASGKPVFSEEKIIGQIDMTVEHFASQIKQEAERETLQEITNKMRSIAMTKLDYPSFDEAVSNYMIELEQQLSLKSETKEDEKE